jgi:OOP family OmpA-OmpF porin
LFLFFGLHLYTFVGYISVYENTQYKFVIMINRKGLLVVVFAALMSQTLFAQKKSPKAADPGPDNAPAAAAPAPAGQPSLQWANRDMTYHGKNYDVLDSAYYPKKRLKQYHQYLDYQEVFPPKPRNMVEAGLGFGLYNVIGNIPTLMLWNKGGAGLNIHVRKAFGYIFSLRAQYIYGVARNLDREPTTGYGAPYTNFNLAPNYFYTPLYNAIGGQTPHGVYRATRMESSQLNLDMIFNVYNINFHKARNSLSFYGYAGLGALAYKTRVNALDGKFQPYDFSTIVKDPNAKASVIRKELQKGQTAMDKTYESVADNTGAYHILDHKTLDFAPSVGGGVEIRINKSYNVQIEDRYTFPVDGYLDGTRYGQNLGNAVSTGRSSDAINYFSVGINKNFKSGKKCVEPLWWINPLDHSYSELSYPRHMKLPNPVLPDKDEDGVTDQFDKCPKTPAGIAVDAHGCPMDSDGDGVPDYKDKQLITPTECQPVDADGVGHCPCPDGCKEMNNNSNKNPCGNLGAGTLLFPASNNGINKAIEIQLATLAGQMQANPLCKVVIVGGGSGSKAKEQHSWEHVNAVIEYMSEKNNISRDRFIFKYGEAGDENIVTYRSANVDEAGDSNVPPPHPDIK